MGFDQAKERWNHEMCQSELSVEDVTMKCTCNAFQSNIIGIFTDFTRTLGEPVQFPVIEVEEPEVEE